ncbi:hypothetical protein FE257_010424 [Aspergillus nanangensis]|uniref:Major facilitator superfamily (MFS) profile domain-containing protein n=1 Tax=Aspergillus nanangensis TaxID=2582783 RepID=A0AAD4GS34_ASPNN|nr:hypothetical protein FE257_010424 [Aspergillus nanangensis]
MTTKPQSVHVESLKGEDDALGISPPNDPEGFKEKREEPKTAPDGITILNPQPSNSSEDPLNWSNSKKGAVLAVVIACSFLPDYGSVTGAATLGLQAKEYGNSPDTVNHSQAGNQFMVGAGGVIAVMLSAYFGRLPVLFWFMVAAFATSVGQAGSHGFIGFFIPRVMNGFFAGVAQGGGLMFIRDMFFHHQQPRKINLWQSCVILSPFMGPLLASFMTIQLSWRWPFWIYTIETGLALLAVIFLAEETYYDRSLSVSDQPVLQSRWKRLVGIEQWHSRRLRNTFPQAILRSVRILKKPVVLLVNIYYVCIFAWLVAINATLPIFLTAGYGFGSKQIARYYTRRSGGRFDPESRLIIVWFAILFMVAGLILVGFALGRSYHYMLVALGWGCYTFGVIINSASLNMYLLNSYPEASGEVGMWINFSRTAGGFIISYFQVQWVGQVGAEVTFGTQAAVCVAVFPIVVVLQVFGKRMRAWGGELNFATN